MYIHVSMPNPAPASGEICLCAALRRASRAATRLYDERMKSSGLKVTQFSLLRNIGRVGAINVTDLANRLDLERTALGRNLDLLERKGLIRTRGVEGDQRTRLIELTEQGRKAEAAAVPHWRKAQSEMRRRLGKGEFGALGAVLAEMGGATDSI